MPKARNTFNQQVHRLRKFTLPVGGEHIQRLRKFILPCFQQRTHSTRLQPRVEKVPFARSKKHVQQVLTDLGKFTNTSNFCESFGLFHPPASGHKLCLSHRSTESPPLLQKVRKTKMDEITFKDDGSPLKLAKISHDDAIGKPRTLFLLSDNLPREFFSPELHVSMVNEMIEMDVTTLIGKPRYVMDFFECVMAGGNITGTETVFKKDLDQLEIDTDAWDVLICLSDDRKKVTFLDPSQLVALSLLKKSCVKEMAFAKVSSMIHCVERLEAEVAAKLIADNFDLVVLCRLDSLEAEKQTQTLTFLRNDLANQRGIKLYPDVSVLSMEDNNFLLHDWMEGLPKDDTLPTRICNLASPESNNWEKLWKEAEVMLSTARAGREDVPPFMDPLNPMFDGFLVRTAIGGSMHNEMTIRNRGQDEIVTLRTTPLSERPATKINLHKWAGEDSMFAVISPELYKHEEVEALLCFRYDGSCGFKHLFSLKKNSNTTEEASPMQPDDPLLDAFNDRTSREMLQRAVSVWRLDSGVLPGMVLCLNLKQFKYTTGEESKNPVDRRHTRVCGVGLFQFRVNWDWIAQCYERVVMNLSTEIERHIRKAGHHWNNI